VSSPNPAVSIPGYTASLASVSAFATYAISHAVAINGEKGLLVTVTGNRGLLQNRTAVRRLLRSADDSVVAIGVAHGSIHHSIGTSYGISSAR
jgi:hypothetical protein